MFIISHNLHSAHCTVDASIYPLCLYIYMILPPSPSHFMFQNCTLVLNMHSLILHRLQYRILFHSLSFFFITSFLFSLPLSSFHYLLTSFHHLLPPFITAYLFSLPLSSFHYLFPLFITSLIKMRSVEKS
jgi:hypothetical protein